MRIAFASCLCSQVFAAQPVWDSIAKHKPDYLVLLGDSIYLDINTTLHPQDMDDNQFSQHIFARYQELLNQPQFTAFVKSLPKGRVFAVWDDHDFLWNDALGAQVGIMPQHKEKVRLATAFMEAFRATLAAGLAPGSFPDKLGDDAFWKPRKPLSTPSIKLPEDVWLHLADVRTHRTGAYPLPANDRTILGNEQKQRFETAVRNAPDAVHLFASATTISDWKHYPRDLDWILELAGKNRMMVLSGDVHYNDVDAFYMGGFPLHEITSSGAAVRDTVVVGDEQQNFGLLDIDAQQVQVRLFHFGTEELKYARRFDRKSWVPAG